MRKITIILTMVICLVVSGSARATLFNRGSGLIYDSDQDITWLQDANLAKTSGFDADGTLSWTDANAWADGLMFGGFDDWRLPITTQPDSTCSGQTSDLPPLGFNFGCTGSEMGHLSNVDGISPSSQGLFTNIQSFYWSGTEFAPRPIEAWFFNFDRSQQGANLKDVNNFAWAVRDGDVAPIPEPSTMLLLASGLIGLGFFRRRRKQEVPS